MYVAVMLRRLARHQTQLHLLLMLLAAASVVTLLRVTSLDTDDVTDDITGDAAEGESLGVGLPARGRRARRAVRADTGRGAFSPASTGFPASSASRGSGSGSGSASPCVYVITATYPRPEQEADLVRLSQTLMHAAPRLFWVLVEDAVRRTPAVTALLRRSGLRHVHLLGEQQPPTPSERPRFWGRVPRGVTNRNTGLSWVRRHATDDGVVYFADDDNTYDIRLFSELLKTRGVSVFPVGLVTELGVSSPVVRDGKVVAFFDGWSGGRLFALDMAGFAVSVRLLKQRPRAVMPFRAGYEEDGFLQALGVTPEELQPLADNCTQILVWHTQTQRVAPFEARADDGMSGTNLVHLLKHLAQNRRTVS